MVVGERFMNVLTWTIIQQKEGRDSLQMRLRRGRCISSFDWADRHRDPGQGDWLALHAAA